MPLILELNTGDALRIGTGTVVRIEKKKGQKVRVSIDSDYVVRVQHGTKADHGERPEKPDATKATNPFERPPRT